MKAGSAVRARDGRVPGHCRACAGVPGLLRRPRFVAAKGMQAGILALLIVTVGVLGGVWRFFFIYLRRRVRPFEELAKREGVTRCGSFCEIPVAASAHAGEIDHMTVLTHWLMAVLFVGWGAFFIYTLVRFRAGANPKANYQGVKSHLASYIEWAVAAVELVLLVAFAIPAWAARVDAFPSEAKPPSCASSPSSSPGTCTIRAPTASSAGPISSSWPPDNPLGLDRSDPAAKDDITTINQLNLPVNKPVIMHLSSKDVIHSFSLIQMRVKQDAIPGKSIPVWFTPTMTGDWEINCSQLCGLGHYRMRGFYSIKTQEAYDAWLKEQAAELCGTAAVELLTSSTSDCSAASASVAAGWRRSCAALGPSCRAASTAPSAGAPFRRAPRG